MARKATGKSTPVEQGLPVRQLSHFHPPPGCFLFQRSEVWAPMRTPCWGRRSWAAPGASPARVRLAPQAPTEARPTPRVKAALLPPSQQRCFLAACPVAPRDTQERTRSLSRGCKVGRARGQHGPPAGRTGQQGNASLPSASQRRKSAAPSPQPGSRRPGSLPGCSSRARLAAGLLLPARNRQAHLGAARSGAGTPGEAVGGTAVTPHLTTRAGPGSQLARAKEAHLSLPGPGCSGPEILPPARRPPAPGLRPGTYP